MPKFGADVKRNIELIVVAAQSLHEQMAFWFFSGIVDGLIKMVDGDLGDSPELRPLFSCTFIEFREPAVELDGHDLLWEDVQDWDELWDEMARFWDLGLWGGLELWYVILGLEPF